MPAEYRGLRNPATAQRRRQRLPGRTLPRDRSRRKAESRWLQSGPNPSDRLLQRPTPRLRLQACPIVCIFWYGCRSGPAQFDLSTAGSFRTPGAFRVRTRKPTGGTMPAGRATPKNIDEYVASFSPEVQVILQKIRLTIRRAAPGAKEIISYKIPAFRLNGILVYFAAFKKHIGLYPPVRGDAKLVRAASAYAGE